VSREVAAGTADHRLCSAARASSAEKRASIEAGGATSGVDGGSSPRAFRSTAGVWGGGA